MGWGGNWFLVVLVVLMGSSVVDYWDDVFVCYFNSLFEIAEEHSNDKSILDVTRI
jgi:hypothetical protein